MKVYRKGTKKQDEKSGHFSFPDNKAELTDETVKDFRMEATLKRFGRQLLAQFGKDVIGVDLTGISFHLIYEPSEKE